MAPTETLAEQHFATLQALMPGELVQAALLTGSTPGGRRADLLGKLASGELKLLVGTHALIEEAVEFDRLAVAVVDEQHRFGVNQRRALDRKAPDGARAARAAHDGDADPAHARADRLRRPRRHRPARAAGRPAADRHPRVRHRGASARAPTSGSARSCAPAARRSSSARSSRSPRRCRRAPPPPSTSGCAAASCKRLRGRAPARPDAPAREAGGDGRVRRRRRRRARGHDGDRGRHRRAERHRDARRGRRALRHLASCTSCAAGSAAASTSRCACCSGPRSRARLRALAEHRDGFELAEIDLELRGEGEMLGTRQSGLQAFRFARLPEDVELLERARMRAREILDDDPELERPSTRCSPRRWWPRSAPTRSSRSRPDIRCAAMTRVAWNGEPEWRTEVCELKLADDGLAATGAQLGADPTPVPRGLRARGAARLGRRGGCAWRSAASARSSCATTARARWAGVENAAELEGALDCDLAFSPLTNLMPVRRHRLHEQPGTVDFAMAWVSLPDLAVHRSQQRYEHLAPGPRALQHRTASWPTSSSTPTASCSVYPRARAAGTGYRRHAAVGRGDDVAPCVAAAPPGNQALARSSWPGPRQPARAERRRARRSRVQLGCRVERVDHTEADVRTLENAVAVRAQRSAVARPSHSSERNPIQSSCAATAPAKPPPPTADTVDRDVRHAGAAHARAVGAGAGHDRDVPTTLDARRVLQPRRRGLGRATRRGSTAERPDKVRQPARPTGLALARRSSEALLALSSARRRPPLRDPGADVRDRVPARCSTRSRSRLRRRRREDRRRRS